MGNCASSGGVIENNTTPRVPTTTSSRPSEGDDYEAASSNPTAYSSNGADDSHKPSNKFPDKMVVSTIPEESKEHSTISTTATNAHLLEDSESSGEKVVFNPHPTATHNGPKIDESEPVSVSAYTLDHQEENISEVKHEENVEQDAREPQTTEHRDIPAEEHHDKSETSNHEPHVDVPANDVNNHQEIKEEQVAGKDELDVETTNNCEDISTLPVRSPQDVSHPQTDSETIHKTLDENTIPPTSEQAEAQTKLENDAELEVIADSFIETPGVNQDNQIVDASKDEVQHELHHEVTEHVPPTTENHETLSEVKHENGEELKEEVHVAVNSSEDQLEAHHQNGEVSNKETTKVEDNLEGDLQSKLSSVGDDNQEDTHKSEEVIQENI